MNLAEFRILGALNEGFIFEEERDEFWTSIDGIMAALAEDGLPPLRRHAVVSTLGRMQGLGGGMSAHLRRLRERPLVQTKPRPDRRDRNLYRMTDWGLRVLGA